LLEVGVFAVGGVIDGGRVEVVVNALIGEICHQSIDQLLVMICREQQIQFLQNRRN